MAIRLGPYILYGELRNTSHYYTSGAFVLRGEAEGETTVLHAQLTGNCDPDLLGKCVRFFPAEDDPEGRIFNEADFPRLQLRQIGPTGIMTSQGWCRTLPCPAEEYLRRSRLGEPPPTEWKRRLYLEWFGQNGRVVIELAGATVEECVREGGDENDDGDWSIIPNTAAVPDLAASQRNATLGATEINVEDGRVTSREIDTSEYLVDPENVDSIQFLLDQEAAAIDRLIEDEPDDDEASFLRQMNLVESGEGEPLTELLGDATLLPPADALSDAALVARLKAILGQLALLGIALDVCEHYSERDCYTLLRDKIIPEETAIPELAGSGWVQHNSTHDYCPECAAKYDEEFDPDDPPF